MCKLNDEHGVNDFVLIFFNGHINVNHQRKKREGNMGKKLKQDYKCTCWSHFAMTKINYVNKLTKLFVQLKCMVKKYISILTQTWAQSSEQNPHPQSVAILV